MDTICSSHKSLYRDFLSTRPTRLKEPPPVSPEVSMTPRNVFGGQSKKMYELMNNVRVQVFLACVKSVQNVTLHTVAVGSEPPRSLQIFLKKKFKIQII